MHHIAYWLSLLLIFLIPLEKGAHIEGFGTISRLMGLVVAAVWLLSTISDGVRRTTLFHGLVCLFALWSAVSIFWSVDPDSTIERMGTYVRMAFFVVIIWDLFRTENSVRLALQAFVLGGLIPAASTILNYVAGAERVHGRFASAAGDSVNATGFVLALTIPAAFYLAMAPVTERRAQVLRWLNIVCVFVALFAIVLTATRFAILMTAPAWLYALTLLFRMNRVRAIGVTVAMICGLLVVVSYSPQKSLDRLATTHTEVTAGDLTGRKLIWSLGLESCAKYPLLGLGAGNQGVPCIAALGFPKAMHNSFLAVMVELGIVGIAILIAILLSVIKQVSHMPRSAAIFWLTMLAVWGLGNLPITAIYTKETWLLLGLLIADSRALRETDPEEIGTDEFTTKDGR
jgi:O-antigen ligase